MSAERADGTMALRHKLLSAEPTVFGLAPTAELPHVWGTIMEMRVGKAVVSLVAVAEGSTSLYFSTGGGVIGGGEHESVRAASQKLLAFVEIGLDLFVPIEKPLEVIAGSVSFAVFTYDGLRGARDHEQKVKDRQSPLWPAFYLGQDVITALRLTTEKSAG